MMSNEKETPEESYKDRQHWQPKDRWVRKNPPRLLNRKARRELAKRMKNR